MLAALLVVMAEPNLRTLLDRRGLLLDRIEAGRFVRSPHPRAQPARQHDGPARSGHGSRAAQRAGTRRASQTPLMTKSAIQTAACAVLPYRTLPVPKSAA